MTDRPIIMHPISVRALDSGRKTQTRRILKPQPEVSKLSAPFRPEPRGGRAWVFMQRIDRTDGYAFAGADFRIPYAVGDRLWVREAWALMPRTAYALPKTVSPDPDIAAYYRADFDHSGKPQWKPSIHMSRWASRFTLTITEVRVQRLRDISNEDAQAEGIEFTLHRDPLGPCKWASAVNESRAWNTPIAAYKELWDKLHGPGAWGTNPWVVAITFETRKGNIDRI